jgi:hypothetical protein
MQREKSPAYCVLRASAKRLLAFVGTVEDQSGGPVVTLWNDQLEAVIGSRRVFVPGLHELHALGLVVVKRLPKRHLVARSEDWRRIKTKAEARAISIAARARGGAPLQQPGKPAVPEQPTL